MAQQTIGLGSSANDGNGDDLRTAGGKINDNFTELYGGKQDELSEGAFVDGDKTKLDGIESGADVTDATNVAASGAAMAATLASTANGDGAALIGVEDSAANFTGDNVEAVLAELAGASGGFTQEQIEDFVGGMVTGNTETGITVTYQDGDGTLDFAVGGLTTAETASGSKTGSDTKFVTGTAGSDGDLAIWNADGDLVGTTPASLADPDADRIAFWDDSAGQMTWLTPGTGLSITDTTITSTYTVTEGDVTAHEAALSITESQISDLGTYLTADDLLGAGGGLSNIVEDTTPQLGGDLDLNGNVITGMVIGTNIQAYDANLPTWPSTVDATEVGYLNGVTSAIQTQLDAKVDSDPTGVTGADQVTNVMSLTTSEFGAITPDSATLYLITDAT